MGSEKILKLLGEQLKLAEASAAVLKESQDRARPILSAKDDQELDASQRETLEALTARFSRFSDYLTQRLFRTLDELELTQEGSLLDRFNRMEKRSILPSAGAWRDIRDLRNQIAHEYLIEKSDEVVKMAFQHIPQLFEVFENFKTYLHRKYSIN